MSNNEKYKYHRVSVAIPLTRKEQLETNIKALGFDGATDIFHFISLASPEELGRAKAVVTDYKRRMRDVEESNKEIVNLLSGMTPEEIQELTTLAKSRTRAGSW